jgi:hypothetical protein
MMIVMMFAGLVVLDASVIVFGFPWSGLGHGIFVV